MRLPENVEPLVVDDAGEWIVFRHADRYGLLCRPELTPGMIEDTIMEEDRPLPDDISEVLEQSRALWPEFRKTGVRVVAALVAALDMMQERYKPPVFKLNVVQDKQ